MISLLAWTHAHTKKLQNSFSHHAWITVLQKQHTNIRRTNENKEKHKRAFATHIQLFVRDTRWLGPQKKETKKTYTSELLLIHLHISSPLTPCHKCYDKKRAKTTIHRAIYFVTMILPSQVLFPFIKIRRRALRIRKCSEISASIHIRIFIYVYTYTRSQR